MASCLTESLCTHVTCRFSQGELEKLDSEGRVIMTDHGAFVLINVYGPAISTEDSAEERYAFKLQFYKVRCQAGSSVCLFCALGAGLMMLTML